MDHWRKAGRSQIHGPNVPYTVYLSDLTSGFSLGVLETLTAFNVRFTIEPVLVETPDRTCEVDAEDLWFYRLVFWWALQYR